MPSFDNIKSIENLQNQVLKNSNAIEALTQGLKIVGVGPIIPESLKDGEAYLVGTTAPYDLKIKIDGNIIDLGQFPKEGPKGDQGPAGPISKLNSICFSNLPPKRKIAFFAFSSSSINFSDL